MRPPPNAQLSHPAEIVPSADPSDASSSHTASPPPHQGTPHPDLPGADPINPPSVFATTSSTLPRASVGLYDDTFNSRIYDKIQRLRCLPIESSPLSWSVWTESDEPWLPDEEEEPEEEEEGEVNIHMASIPSSPETIRSGIEETRHTYPPSSSFSPDLEPPTDCPPSPRPDQGAFSPQTSPPSPRVEQSGFTTPPRTSKQDSCEWLSSTSPAESPTDNEENAFVDLPLTEYPPRPPSTDELSPRTRSIRLRVKSTPSPPSPPSSSSTPPSISPGSSRTRIIIRRPAPKPPSDDAPASSSALASITQGEPDTDMDDEEDDGHRRSLQRSHYPDNLRISLRLRDRSVKAAKKTRGSLTVGGRVKVYDETNPYLFALLRAWEDGLVQRWDPVEAYRTMGMPMPSLGSPPPGFGPKVSPEKGKEKEGGSRSGSKTSKRLRYSPESPKKEELPGEEGSGMVIRSPEGQRRKKGKMSQLELGSVPMTRMPSPVFNIDDFGRVDTLVRPAFPPRIRCASDDAMDDVPAPSPPSATPHITISIDPPSPTSSSRYTVNPRTGRRSLIAPMELAKPVTPYTPHQSLSSRFSPPSPGDQDSPPWEVTHHEFAEQASPTSPTGPSIQPISALGLNLGGALDGAHSPGSGAQTPLLSSDIARDDAVLVEESQRLRLCAAIEELATQHTSRPTDADWTPPMRGSGIDDTPSTVADELITTPEMDMADLPSSSTSSPAKAEVPDSDDEEEMPRPRLDKGKGRARPEDDVSLGERGQSLSVSTEPERTVSRQYRREVLPEEDMQATLEGLVMEVSRLEAQQMELVRDGGGGESPLGGSLQRRIKQLNRQIKRLSRSIEFVDQPIRATSPAGYVDSDEEIAYRLQQEYERQDARFAEEERRAAAPRLIQKPRPLGGVQMERTHSPPRHEEPSRTPRLARTARQLTFGSPDQTAPAVPARVPVSSLLSRSSIFGAPDTEGPMSRSAMLDGIRLRNRNQASTRSPDQPIIPPQLYPIPQQPKDKVQIVVTPPTPVVHLRTDPEARSSFLADPLEMSALALGEVEVLRDDQGIADVEMEENDDGASDSGASDETIRPPKRESELQEPLDRDETAGDKVPLRRALSEPFGTPTAVQPTRSLSADDSPMDDSPPAIRRTALDLERPARVLFGSPEVERKEGFDEADQKGKRGSKVRDSGPSFDDLCPTKTLSPDSYIVTPLLSESPLSYLSPASPRSPRPDTPTMRKAYFDFGHGSLCSDRYLPGELAERLEREAGLIARQKRRQRVRMAMRGFVAAGKLGTMVLLIYLIVSGFLAYWYPLFVAAGRSS